MIIDFKGIILQPLSIKKTPWEGFNKNKEFLDFFQTTFKRKIKNSFYVNHNTIDFSDYLLIPYMNKICFGAYYIEYGDKVNVDNYSHAYFINYKKSYEFVKEEHISSIIDNLEFYNGSYELISNDNRTIFYKLDYLPNNFKQDVCKMFKNDTIE